MNRYNLDLRQTSGSSADVHAFLASFTIGHMLSGNFNAVPAPFPAEGNANIGFQFDLPFSLSNILSDSSTSNAVKAFSINYDTRFQNVKEFLDKPYCVAGRIVSLLYDNSVVGAYDIKRDLDSFVSYQVSMKIGAAATKSYVLYLGVANGTLSESYSPFGVNNANPTGGLGIVGIKFYDPRDLTIASLQDVIITAVNNATGPIPIGGGVSAIPSTGSNTLQAVRGLNALQNTSTRPILSANGLNWVR